MNDGLPRRYDSWLEAPYQSLSRYMYKCVSCDKLYDEDIPYCLICEEKVIEIDNALSFNEGEPERTQDR